MIIAQKDLNRQKNYKKTFLRTQIYTKLTIEDIYCWIEYGFNELKNKKDMIKKTFRICGYYEEESIREIDDVSCNFDAMEIEDDERIPIHEDEIENNSDHEEQQ